MSKKQLGVRAVACARWEWMPGMMLQWKTENGSHYRGRVCDTWSFEDEGALYCEGHEDRFTRDELKAAWPDLDDSATIGCLLALVRAAYRNDKLWAFPVEDARGEWSVTIRNAPQKWFYGSTEAEALVAALEASER